MRIQMVPHSPEWRQAFTQEAERITAALGDCAATVHHIGSTAIPGIYAKPVLDLLLAAQHPNDIEAYMDGKDAFIQAIDRRAAGHGRFPFSP